MRRKMARMQSLAADLKRRRHLQRAPAPAWTDDIVDTLAELSSKKSYKCIYHPNIRNYTTKKARPRRQSIDAKRLRQVMYQRRRAAIQCAAASMCESEHAPDSDAWSWAQACA